MSHDPFWLANIKGISQYPFSLVDGETLNEMGNMKMPCVLLTKKYGKCLQ